MMKKRAAAICLTGILIVGILSGCVKVKVSFSKKDDKTRYRRNRRETMIARMRQPMDQNMIYLTGG